MKIYILVFALLIISPSLVYAQADCPFGIENDTSPGQCGLYLDSDANYICDLSEQGSSGNEKEVLSEDDMKQMTISELSEYFGISSGDFSRGLSTYLSLDVKDSDLLGTLHDENGLCAGVAATIAQNLLDNPSSSIDYDSLENHELISGKELKTKTVSEIAKIYNIEALLFADYLSSYLGASVNSSDDFQELHDEYDLSPSSVKEIAASLQDSRLSSEESSVNNTTVNTRPKYKFFEIVFFLLSLYLISFLSAKAGYISLLWHGRIWNILLLITFLISGVLGIMLVMKINYGWFMSYYALILKFHVELGVAMVLISFFHILKHWKYYAVIVKRKK